MAGQAHDAAQSSKEVRRAMALSICPRCRSRHECGARPLTCRRRLDRLRLQHVFLYVALDRACRQYRSGAISCRSSGSIRATWENFRKCRPSRRCDRGLANSAERHAAPARGGTLASWPTPLACWKCDLLHILTRQGRLPMIVVDCRSCRPRRGGHRDGEKREFAVVAAIFPGPFHSGSQRSFVDRSEL